MLKAAAPHRGALAVAALVTALFAAFLVVSAAQAAATAGSQVISTAKNANLGKTVLVNRRGLTLSP